MKTAMITGINGQDGILLSKFLIKSQFDDKFVFKLICQSFSLKWDNGVKL